LVAGTSVQAGANAFRRDAAVAVNLDFADDVIFLREAEECAA
jgi:hypothetical protein